jgi:glutaredoxin
MIVKIYGKEDCAKCKTTKSKIDFFLNKWNLKDRVEISNIDLDSDEGMTEGALDNVVHVPTTVIEENGKTLKRWDGEVPNSDEFKEYLLSPK